LETNYSYQYCAPRSNKAIITADVNLGRALVSNSSAPDVSLAKMRKHGRDSAKRPPRLDPTWDCAVCESERITLQSIKDKTRLSPTQTPPPNSSRMSGAESGLLCCGRSSAQVAPVDVGPD
jgi:hypothetical protein